MLSFKLKLAYDTKLNRISEIAQRMQDFTVPFANIISEWARMNQAKFIAGQDMELSGVSGGALTPSDWKPVTLNYYKQKHGSVKRGSRQLFPDWLMVRTGDLMRALTSDGGFAEMVDEHRAVFGTPMDEEAATAAKYNSKTRPTIFFNESQQLMIRRELQDYLKLGGNYKALMFDAAGRAWALRQGQAEMDAGFREAMGS